MNKNIFKSRMRKVLSVFKPQECGHCHNELACPSHTCPFKSEICGDDETLCDCCHNCQYECAMEI